MDFENFIHSLRDSTTAGIEIFTTPNVYTSKTFTNNLLNVANCFGNENLGPT